MLTEGSEADRVRTTISLSGEDISILDEERLRRWRQRRQKVDRSELIREAVRSSFGRPKEVDNDR